MTDGVATTATAKLTNRWLVLTLLLAIAIVNFADRYLLAGVAQIIKGEFQLSDSFMGVLLGPAFALLYTLLGVPAARLADRTRYVAVIAAGCALWSGFTFVTSLVTTPWGMALARVGVGIGEAAYQAPVAALIAAYFPVDQRGRAFALLGTAIFIGQMTGMAGGPALAAAHGWRAPFEYLGLAGIVVALAAFLLIREPPRSVSTGAPSANTLWQVARAVGANASWRYLAFALALGTMSGIGFGMWGPALFARAYGLPPAAAGAAFGLPFGLAGIVGILTYGLVSDRLGRNGMVGPMRLCAAALGIATSFIMVITWVPNLQLAQTLAIPSGLLGGGWSIGIMTGMQFLLPPRHRAAGTALALLVSGLLGNLGGPWLVGMLSDLFGGGLAGLRWAMTIVIPTGFIGAWCAWQASTRLGADQQAMAARL